MIMVFVEGNNLMRRITVRIYYMDKVMITTAMEFAIETLEKAKKIGVIEYNEYVSETTQIPGYNSCISFSVLYKTEEEKEKFLKLLKNYNN